MGNTNTLSARFKVRRGTDSTWNTKNPVLLEGELAYSTDRRLFKVGDGSTTWKNLNYVTATTLVDLVASITELNYLSGVTSSVQTQIDHAKIQVSTSKPNYKCTWFKVTSTETV